jgi:hypothetical protein
MLCVCVCVCVCVFVGEQKRVCCITRTEPCNVEEIMHSMIGHVGLMDYIWLDMRVWWITYDWTCRSGGLCMIGHACLMDYVWLAMRVWRIAYDWTCRSGGLRMIGRAGLMDYVWLDVQVWWITYDWTCRSDGFIHLYVLHVRTLWNVTFSYINQQIHIRKFGRTLAVIFHRHVSVTPVTFIRV